MLVALVALHGVLGVVVLVGARRLGRWGLAVGASAPLVTVSWVAMRAAEVLDGDAVVGSTRWVPELGLGLDLRLDAFAVLMVALVSGVGVVVFAYAWSYFGAADKVARAAGLLTLFAGSMLGVVLADNLLALYVFWELTSVTSYLLIGIDDTEPEARSAALHALLVTGLGGLAMLGGFVLLGQQAGTYRLSGIIEDPPSGAVVAVALVLVLVGAFTKSAQYPFHSWLPGAMVAPTPISAYLHSAAMVKAGVYLVARLAPAFAAVGVWRPLVVGVGLLTMVAGGLRALRPDDLKQLLAFGTISQLGFMTVLLGVGIPEATAAGCALLLAHGAFKAASFMVVGIVDHELGTREIARLPRLGTGWRGTRVVAAVSAASMAGVPPLAGFIAKEEAYAAFTHGGTGDRVVLAGIVAGSVLTFAYSARFVVALWRPGALAAPVERASADHGPGGWFLAPAALLAAASVSLGLLPGSWSSLVDAAGHALDPLAGAHLALWHGVGAPLVLSAVTIAAGAALVGARRRLDHLQGALRPRFTGADAYEAVVRQVVLVAARTTSTLQSGSLPVYAAVILTTAALVPVVALLAGDWWRGWPDAVGHPAHVPIAAVLATAALASALVRRRFAAALLLGVVGYAMAVLFVVQGAPDLALTQFAVETLSVVVFLLVLRRLPDRFERRAPAVGPVPRVAVAAVVGAAVTVLALATSGARLPGPPVSDAMVERALPDGDGRNVVNVILVDIRGLDTLGEVSVLVAAALGVVALGRAGERPRPRAATGVRRRPRVRRRLP